MSKLTKEECVNALEELKGLEIYDDDCDGNTCYESHSKIEDLCSFDVLGQLIEEHFNPPLKLEEDLCEDEATPKKVRRHKVVFPDTGKYFTKFYTPCCDSLLGDDFIGKINKFKYCPECGQALDWEEE